MVSKRRKDITYGVVPLQMMPHRHFRMNYIMIMSPFLTAYYITALLQAGNYLLHSSPAQSDLLGDSLRRTLRMLGNEDKHPAVIGEESPLTFFHYYPPELFAIERSFSLELG